MDFKDFRRKLATDRAFAERFKGCDTPAALVEAAEREGYSFTEDDIKYDIKYDTELLPEEVALASGGTSTPHPELKTVLAFACDPHILGK